MSISIDTYCLQCLLRRNIALAQTLGTEEQAMAFAKEIMKLCINAPEGVSSPWFGPQIADLLHDMYGLDYDRFRQEKLDSNRFVLERLPMIRKRVTGAGRSGVRLPLSGLAPGREAGVPDGQRRRDRL